MKRFGFIDLEEYGFKISLEDFNLFTVGFNFPIRLV